MQEFTIEPLAHHQQSYQNTIFIKILDQLISLPNLNKTITVPMQNKLKEMRKWPGGKNEAVHIHSSNMYTNL
jgi:hypothetical protein